jgi:RsiW-degrading membrane proteinase PrsW (M82 family)
MNSRKIMRSIRLKRRALKLNASEVASFIGLSETEYLLFENQRKEISKEQYNLLFQMMHMTDEDFGIYPKLNKQLPKTFFDLFKIKTNIPIGIEIPKIHISRNGKRTERPSIDANTYRKRFEQEMFHPEETVNTKPLLFPYVSMVLVIMSIIAIIGEQFALSNLVLSAIVPVSLLVIMQEIAIPKQIKGIDTMKYFFFGGMSSILLLYGLRYITDYPDWYLFSDLLTGFVEEFAKIAIVILIFKNLKVKHPMIGILIGFAVGAGFDVFETSDYGTYALLDSGGDFIVMMTEIVGRSIYAIFGIGHHFWTAMIAGTLVLVNDTGKIGFKDFFKPIPLIMFVLIFVIHGLWNFTATYFVIAQFAVLIVSGLLFVRFVYVNYVNAWIDMHIEALAQIKIETDELVTSSPEHIEDEGSI